MENKSASPEVTAKVTEAIGQLNLMADKGREIHKAQDAACARTNSSLYELLSNLYENYVQISSHQELLDAVLDEMKSALKSKGQRVQKNQALNTFVRFVFGTERQRTYNYKRCLQAALDLKVHPKGFKNFIQRQGGIEACKSKNKNSYSLSKKSKQLAAYAKVDQALSATPIATIKLAPEAVKQVAKYKFTFLLAKANSNGDVDVLSLVPDHSPSLEAWAIQSIANVVPNKTNFHSAIGVKEDLVVEAITKAEFVTAKEAA